MKYTLTPLFGPPSWLLPLLFWALQLITSSASAQVLPSVRADNIQLVGAAGVDRARLSWDGFDEEGAVLIMQDVSISDVRPVVTNGDSLRADGHFGAGDSLGRGQYVVAAAFGARKVAVSGLEPGHRYRLDVYSYNANYEYSMPESNGSWTFYFQTPLKTYPAGVVRDSLLAPLYAPDCASIAIGWQGDPDRQSLLVIQDVAESDHTPLPVDGTYYKPNPFFGVGTAIAAGQYVVASAQGKAAQVLQLKAGHRYRLDVIAYSDAYEYAHSYYTSTPGTTYYFTLPSCPQTPPPTVGASNLRAQVLDCSTARLSCKPGNGEGRMFVVRESPTAVLGTFVFYEPAQGEVYPPSNIYSQGLPVGKGLSSDPRPRAWAVSIGKDSSIVVHGLPPGRSFYFSVYEYNTQQGFVLGIDPVTGAPTVGFGPTGNNPGYTGLVSFDNQQRVEMPTCPGVEPDEDVPARRARASRITRTTARLHWQNGDGTGRIAVIRPVRPNEPLGLLLPRQRVSYRPSPFIPLADTTRRDAFVVAKRSNPWRNPLQQFEYRDDSVDVSGLTPNTVYQLEVFEHGDFPTSPVYLLSRPGARAIFITEPAAVDEPLPVVLSAFSVHALPNGQVLAKWTTASEKNSAFFQLEYSADGRAYLPAGNSVAAAGTSSVRHHYEVKHLPPAESPALLYYRLRQVDKDESGSYSPVRSVTRTASAAGRLQLRAFPNPTDAQSRVSVQLKGMLDQTQPVLLTVRTLLGTIVLDRSLPAGEQSETSFSTSGWAPGVYVLDAETAAGHCYSRLLVR